MKVVPIDSSELDSRSPSSFVFSKFFLCEKEKDKALIIGDNLRTDIKGANLIKQDSLFIMDGVHKNEIKRLDNLNNILEKYKVETNFIQEKLNW